MTELPQDEGAGAVLAGAVSAGWRGLALRVVGGLVAGALAGGLWWTSLDGAIGERPAVAASWIVALLVLLSGALGLQIVRTAILLDGASLRSLVRPVVVSHGTNALFATLGDLVEVGLLARLTGRTIPDILVQLVYRAATTASVALAAVLVGAGPLGLSLALGGLLAVVALGAIGTPSWTLAGRSLPRVVPVGWRRATALVVVTAVQLGLVAGSIALSVRATGGDASWALVARAAGAIDLLAYVPVPLANVGLHHAGMTWTVGASSEAAWGAVLHHAVTLGVGVVALVAGLGAPARE